MRKLWSRWMILARKIGQFQSRIILTLFYFIIVAPFGLGVRLFADPLHTRAFHAAHSGWQPRPSHPADLDTARKQG
ncbi:MAG: hypothetical protein ABTQ73_02765 [Caldilineales bacterium]